jgi:hypothetical protein
MVVKGGKMKLLTKEIVARLPAIKSTEDKDPSEIPIIAKFFTPWSNWTWFVTEAELIEDGSVLDENDHPTDFLFFGYVVGHEKELGYFVLSELEEVTGPCGLKIERDLYFSATLAEVMSGKKS